MTDPIISMIRIRAKAKQAFDSGMSIHDNPYPCESAAAKAWHYEFEQLQKRYGQEAA